VTLTEEEVKQVKEQLFEQVENYPDEQRNEAVSQINAMNAEQLEEFLVKNNLIKGSGGGNCIFCSIASGETASYKIDENDEAVAVLDINPLSEGQILIIPKPHKPIDEIPTAMELSQKISKLLKSKLKADEVKTETNNIQGHGIINVIPIYKGKKLERKKAEESELNGLQQRLTQKEDKEEEKEKPEKDEKPAKEERKIKEVKIEDLPFAPVRIP
jgi:diadenosine tetraphosphate (Ap4A) HIT family hydrolase